MPGTTRKGMPFLTAVVLTVAMVVGVMFPSIVIAQGAETYSSELTGVDVTFGGEWVLDDETIYSDSMIESIVLSSMTAGLGIGFLDPAFPIIESRDQFLEGFFGSVGEPTTIDRGDYGEVSYSLDMVNTEGVEFGVFTLFLSNRDHGYGEYYCFFALPSEFTRSMESVQANVTVNGRPALDGIDAAAMGEMVIDNEGIAGGTAATEVETEEANEEDTEPTVETEEPVTDGGALTTEQTTYLDTVELEVSNITLSILEFMGAVEMTTDDDTTNDTTAAETIARVEALWANYTTTAAAVPVPAGMDSVSTPYLSFADDVENMSTTWNAFLDGARSDADVNLDAFFTAVDTTMASGSTVLDEIEVARGADASNESEVATGQDADDATDEPADLATEAPTDEATEEAAATEEPEFVLDEPTEEATADATEEAPETTVDDEAPEDLGLVDDETWVSPQHDIEVTWDSNFEVSDVDAPITSDTATQVDGIQLLWTGTPDTTVFVMIGNETTDHTTADTLEFWTSPGYLEETFGPDAELILSDSTRTRVAIVVVPDPANPDTVVYQEFMCTVRDCSQGVMTSVTADRADVPDLVLDIEEGVLANGDGVTGVFTERELERELGSWTLFRRRTGATSV